MSSHEFDLTGKVALVTGGSRGLGREICVAYAEHGADLAIASRKGEACVALAEELSAAHGVKAVGYGAHVGRWEDCDRLVDAVYADFGKVDVLVNNAGSSPLYPSLVEISEDLFDKVIALNLRGPFRLATLIGTRMADGDGGSIINVSSVSSIMPERTELPYSLAKAGLNAMTSGLARCFGPNVRVNCIMPGPFLTDISKAWPPEVSQRFARTIPAGRPGEPPEIAGAALYLASSASSYTNGAIIKVDGGLSYSPA